MLGVFVNELTFLYLLGYRVQGGGRRGVTLANGCSVPNRHCLPCPVRARASSRRLRGNPGFDETIKTTKTNYNVNFI